jgi:Na+-driven multidrug efflux pump
LLRQLLSIGVPSGLELMVNFLVTTFVYWSLKDLGPSAQGGYGIGARIVLAAAMPATAIAFGAVAVAGQNLGAGAFERVRRIWISTQAGSLLITWPAVVLIEIYRRDIVASFTVEPQTASLASIYLTIMALNLIPLGVSGASTSLLQAMGATRISMAVSLSRAFTFCAIILLTVKLNLLTWQQAWILTLISSALHAAYLSAKFVRHFGIYRARNADVAM